MLRYIQVFPISRKSHLTTCHQKNRLFAPFSIQLVCCSKYDSSSENISCRFLFSMWIRYFCWLMRKMARWTVRLELINLLVILRSCGRQSVAGEERFPFKALLTLNNCIGREDWIYSLWIMLSQYTEWLFSKPRELDVFCPTWAASELKCNLLSDLQCST